MSEEMFIGDYASKRIWIDEHSEWWPTHSRSDTTPYIREDVVLELVEALKWMTAILVVETETDVKAIDRAEAALAKLEESHE